MILWYFFVLEIVLHVFTSGMSRLPITFPFATFKRLKPNHRRLIGQPRIVNRTSSDNHRFQTGGGSEGPRSRSPWTTGRSLMFAAVASSLAYSYGTIDHGNRALRNNDVPKYGDTRSLESVSLASVFRSPQTN